MTKICKDDTLTSAIELLVADRFDHLSPEQVAETLVTYASKVRREEHARQEAAKPPAKDFYRNLDEMLADIEARPDPDPADKPHRANVEANPGADVHEDLGPWKAETEEYESAYIALGGIAQPGMILHVGLGCLPRRDEIATLEAVVDTLAARFPAAEVSIGRTTRTEIVSDDFKHDVLLSVGGDFASPADRQAYAERLAERLGTAAPHP